MPLLARASITFRRGVLPIQLRPVVSLPDLVDLNVQIRRTYRGWLFQAMARDAPAPSGDRFVADTRVLGLQSITRTLMLNFFSGVM